MNKLHYYIISAVLVAMLSFASSAIYAEEAEMQPLDRADDYQSKIPVKVVKRVKLPKSYHEGLFYEDGRIWVVNGKGGDIWKIDPETGSIVASFKPIGTFAEDIVPAGDGTYWYTDWDTKKLYRVKMSDSGMRSEYDITLDPSHPTGAAWTGEKLYLITWTRSVTGTKYHLLQLNKNEKMFRKMQIKRIHEPAHLAWDGKNLWITSWFSQIVYKVDVTNFKVVGSFRSPAPETTGITWDGKYFWITGTNADLYQVQVGS